jgi:hypothetical protein
MIDKNQYNSINNIKQRIYIYFKVKNEPEPIIRVQQTAQIIFTKYQKPTTQSHSSISHEIQVVVRLNHSRTIKTIVNYHLCSGLYPK